MPEDAVPDKNAVAELYQMAELEETVERLEKIPGFFKGERQQIEKIILTPDFHKGAGIPIGTVMMTEGFAVPQAMGNDIVACVFILQIYRKGKLWKTFPN